MSYLEELLPEFRKGAKIRNKNWEKGNYYILKNGEVVNQDNEKVIRFFTEAILTDQWEIYHDPIDWDDIINNRCLCYFWDADNENVKHLGVLKEIEKDGRSKFKSWVSGSFECCRPVRRDEVIFYEDKK